MQKRLKTKKWILLIVWDFQKYSDTSLQLSHLLHNCNRLYVSLFHSFDRVWDLPSEPIWLQLCSLFEIKLLFLKFCIFQVFSTLHNKGLIEFNSELCCGKSNVLILFDTKILNNFNSILGIIIKMKSKL